MTATKAFPTTAVLGVVTDRQLGVIGGIYDVLNYMSGGSLFTHQIPRVAYEAAPVIIAMHPDLQQAVDESAQVTRDNWMSWRDTWLDRYGPEIAVPKFTAGQHEHRDPLSELAEKVQPDNITIIIIKGGAHD